MNFKYSLKKAALLAMIPILFFACDNKSEDPIPSPDPDPDPVVKTPVAVPDAAFEAYLIRQGIDTDKEINQQIYLEDAMERTTMFIFGDELEEKITDLTGLEAFKNLEELHIWDSDISTIDLSEQTQLEALTLAFLKLEEIDLSTNAQLRYLNLRNNTIKDSDLSNNPALTYISLTSNLLEQIDLSANTAVVEVSLTDNQLRSISGLEDAQNLEFLFANVNQLTSFKIAAPKLTRLYIDQNDLTELDIKGSTVLAQLECSSNQLTSIDLTENIELIDLLLSGNHLTALDLVHNTKLEKLDLRGNDLSSLDVSMLPNLNQLDIFSNSNLTCIKIGTNQRIDQVAKHDYQKFSTEGCD